MYRYIKSEKMNLELEEVRVMCLRTVCARKHKHQSVCKLLSLSGFREMTGGSNLVVASLMKASESFIYKDSGFFLYPEMYADERIRGKYKQNGEKEKS